MRKVLIGLSVIAVATATAAIALGGIPGTGDVISHCYHQQSGQLRIYDAEGTTPKGCGTKEQAISWNRTGPQGPSGPQ
jgi:hypothetical protein